MPAVRPDWFDFHKPDYSRVFQLRIDRLTRIRQDPSCLPLLKMYYRDNPIQFIMDWGCTQDPRNPEAGLPATMPFLLFDRQIEFADYILRKRTERAPGLCDKSRGVGASWICMALSCALCLFNSGLTIGFGSRKQEYVDVLDDPKSLFFKARSFMRLLPPEFRGGWTVKDAPFMRMVFRETGSGIFGEAGDNIGRGGRTSIYFVDESAHLERPELVDAALSENTNVRIDLSSVKGMANPFATKRFAGLIEPFTFHWRSDPRKNYEGSTWYADLKAVRGLSDVVIAQEYDIDYSASVSGVLVPSSWIQSAIGACAKLGITPQGKYKAAYDVADQGGDENALAGRHGVSLDRLAKWSGTGDDIFKSVANVFRYCDAWGIKDFDYDGIGVGSGVRGDARILNQTRPVKIKANPWLASNSPRDPSRKDMMPGQTNEDAFKNLKAQEWWALRLRFERTHRWVTQGIECDPSDIISIDIDDPALLAQLQVELSQPTFDTDNAGKLIIDKAPDGTKSPNLADSVMIVFAKGSNQGLNINPAAVGRPLAGIPRR